MQTTIRQLACLYSPPPSRAVLQALCRIEAEIRSSLPLTHEVAHARVAWWREECERTRKGEARHPLTQALTRACPPELLDGLPGLAGTAVWDLAAATFETRRELGAYCERWAAALIEPAAAHARLSAQLPPTITPPRWRALGATLREIELLSHVQLEARLGRLRVPLDELARAGVAPEALAASVCPPALARLVAARHEALRQQLAATVQDIIPALQPAVRGLLVWAQLAWRQSRQAQLALPRPLRESRLGTLGATWAAWRAARSGERRTFRLHYDP